VIHDAEIIGLFQFSVMLQIGGTCVFDAERLDTWGKIPLACLVPRAGILCRRISLVDVVCCVLIVHFVIIICY